MTGQVSSAGIIERVTLRQLSAPSWRDFSTRNHQKPRVRAQVGCSFPGREA